MAVAVPIESKKTASGILVRPARARVNGNARGLGVKGFTRVYMEDAGWSFNIRASLLVLGSAVSQAALDADPRHKLTTTSTITTK